MQPDEQTLRKMQKAYYTQKYFCKKRLDAAGNPVEMRLTFPDWADIWWSSGHWFNRGCRKGQYVMSRVNDLGHYEVGNVFIQLHTQNSSDAHRLPSNALTGRGRACTVDGITIYPSNRALVRALGNGKNGRRSPNFRYV